MPGGDVAKAHVMTSIGDTSGYSIGAFAPKQVFTGVREVRWDVNQTDLGDRQFTEVAIIPVDKFDFDKMPCNASLPCAPVEVRRQVNTFVHDAEAAIVVQHAL